MSLSVSEQYYIAQHRKVPERELSKTMGVPLVSVRAALKKLPPEESSVKIVAATNSPKKLADFSVHAGTTSMTPSQAKNDDDIIKAGSPQMAPQPGIFIIDPSKPVL